MRLRDKSLRSLRLSRVLPAVQGNGLRLTLHRVARRTCL